MLTVFFLIVQLSASCGQHLPDIHPHVTAELQDMTTRAADSIIAEAYLMGRLATDEVKYLMDKADENYQKLPDVSNSLKRSAGAVADKIKNAEAKLMSAIENMASDSSVDPKSAEDAKQKAAEKVLDVLKSMSSKLSEVGKDVVGVENKMMNAVKDYSSMEANSINENVRKLLEGIQFDSEELAKKGAELKRDYLTLTNPVKDFELDEGIRSEL